VVPLTVRIRWRLLPLLAVLAMAWSLLSAAPAHAVVEYLGVRDWSTFASWRAPSGNIYTGQYKASVAHDTSNGNIAWRINTRCQVNGQSATCKRLFSGGLVGYVSSPSESWVWPWGTTDRESGAIAGEVIWQGEWHNPATKPQNWFFTWGGVKVTWTAPNPDMESTIHNACSHDVYWNGTQIRTRAAPSGCIPH
jgi:hypothetical protein